MKIGILQCGHLPPEIEAEQGKYSDMIARLFDGQGFTYEVFNVVDGVFPDGPKAAEGWIVTGSRHGIYDPLPWIAPLEALVREIHAAERPLVGICFGHQLIAQALGGKAEKFSGGWSLGLKDYRIGDAVLAMPAWHQDQVITPPPGATTLGQGDVCAHAVMAIGPHTLTVQPHPEFDRAAVAGLIETRGAALPQDLVATARDRLDTPEDRNLFAGWMAAVLRGAPADVVPDALRSQGADA